MYWLKGLTEKIRNLIDVLSTTGNSGEIEVGLHECDKAVRKINHNLRNAMTNGEKQRLLSALNSIKSYRAQIKHLIRKGRGLRETAKHRVRWEDSESAFNNRIHTGIITNLQHKDPKHFLEDSKAIFERRLHYVLKKNSAVKVNVSFCGEFVISKADKVIKELKYFTTSNSPIYQDTNISEWFDSKVLHPIMKQLQEFQEKDSGWALKKVVNLGVNINLFNPMRGSSYIDLPSHIKNKKACVNVKNDDQACFAWAVVSALYPADKHSDRTSMYPSYTSILNLKGIQFPMTIHQIKNFENQNDISINIYTLKLNMCKYTVVPFRLTKKVRDKHVNLLMIHNQYYDEYKNSFEGESDKPFRTHYVWIKDLSRLVSSQLSMNRHKKHFCNRCFHYFYSHRKLCTHMDDCMKTDICIPQLPSESEKVLRFKNFKNKCKAPFVIYADMEAILVPTKDMKEYQKHIPCSVGYYVKCSYDDSLSFYRSYRGEDCMRWLCEELKRFAENVETVFMCSYDINMTSLQEEDFQKSNFCHICEKPFTYEDKKVRDHNHLLPTDNYRGAAHEGCNINFKGSHTIPVVFHNLSGYDAHFIIKDIALAMDGRVDLLPITKEKYISFTKNIDDSSVSFRFIDSFKFMNSSLDKLSSYLTEHPILKTEFSQFTEEQIKLLTKKGVYPYDFTDSFDKFNYPHIPSHDQFFNRLVEKNISAEQYQHAQLVWNSFGIRNLGEYSDLYLKTDIILLAEVFEQFRSSCHRTYNLDPAHYYTLPGYTWDCMLYTTRQELELLTDYDMVLFIQKGIRGGLSQVCGKRRVQANNKYSPNYDSTKADTYLMYFDINNQYGKSMSEFLPYGGFEWVEDIQNFDVMSVSDDAEGGFILEVDLEYPEHLHDIHKDIPFCPEHLNTKVLSASHVKDDNRCMNDFASGSTKLMASLYDKTKYVLHYRNLKQAIANGLVLKKIHRVLKFKQSLWLKPYIDLNTELRRQAKNEFEKNLFKFDE
ncbi:unnamed protein product [Callosobruchus maculatus]|uniref:DNA-directed DNA polymerase n=1 Tax=Callosobruchus maculatus TaxID=64391 RepID=A0A653CF82_CALMS|nr:unnamed protein product [Callosobruchus maculatus]